MRCADDTLTQSGIDMNFFCLPVPGVIRHALFNGRNNGGWGAAAPQDYTRIMSSLNANRDVPTHTHTPCDNPNMAG